MAQSYTVTTVAGSDPVRDGGAAQNAILQNATGIAVDSAGNLYIADAASNRIRKVIPDRTKFAEEGYAAGKISTVVGQGAPYFAGDGGSADQAYLSGPNGIAFGPDGSLYLADTNNSRIRKVAIDGSIQTVAGTGEQGLGDDGGLATSTRIILPMSLAVDGDGAIYFSEGVSTARIRRVTADGMITTYAGGGDLGLDADGGSALNARLMAPVAIALDGSGNLWVAETSRHVVRRISPDGRIVTVAGTGIPGQTGDGGPAIQAQLNSPRALVVDVSGNLYIGDSGNRVVRRVSQDGVIRPIFPPLAPASGLAFDGAGNLLIAYGSQLNLWMPTYTSIGAPIVGDSQRGRDGIPAIDSLLINPTSIAGDTTGNLYIAEPVTSRIRVVDRSGIINTLAGGSGDFFSGDGGRAVLATLNNPLGVKVGADGSVWIADTANNRIRRVGPDEIIHTVAGNGKFGAAGDDGPATEAELTNPRFIAVDASGNSFVADSIDNRIRKVTPDGVIRTIAGNGDIELHNPTSLAVDGSGALYFLDQSGKSIRKISTDGAITTVLDTQNARCIAVEPSGNLFICAGNTISRISADGSIERIAGGEVPGFSGDGGLALDAQFSAPADLWIDPDSAAIYVVDQGNHRIRKLTPAVQ